MNERTCTVPDCTKPTRTAAADLCKMHYHRQYRHGSVHTVFAKGEGPSKSNGRKYKMQYVGAAHLLADKQGRAYVHRVLLFNELGSDVACHYCGKGLDWSLPRTDPAAVQVDHLNDHGDDNRLENLVPCCRKCNGDKAQARRHEAFIEAGWWTQNDTIARLRGKRRTSMPAVTG